MRYTDEYRDPQAARRLIDEIGRTTLAPFSIMEFCGGHTHAIMRYGIRQMLEGHVHMLSGPGCPVCVTADVDIDRVIALATVPGVMVATFGDMIRVPGTRSSLQQARATGADVRIVYSALDALELAQQNPDASVVMLGIGFETTVPTVAASVIQAQEMGLTNYFVYSMHKLTEPATRGILDAGEVHLDAVLGPGHVSAITGWGMWEFLPRDYGIPCAISGFEPLDILQAVLDIARALRDGEPRVSNSYRRGVTAEGNAVAQSLVARVFSVDAAEWRGLGEIPDSGLWLRPEYQAFDARAAIEIPEDAIAEPSPERRACRCGEVLRGVMTPPECPLYDKLCTPATPIGPCMVSAEGSCAAYYRYGGSII